MIETVNIIINNANEEYLLQMRDGTDHICDPLKWGFFGGGMEKGETPIIAAQRETEEELGLHVAIDFFTIIGSAQVGENKLVNIVKMGKHITWGDFKVNEGAGAAFFTKNEIMKIGLSQTSIVVINQILFKK